MHRRTITSLAAAIILIGVPALAAAHAPLTGSTPKAGDNLETAPTKVTLTFKDELDPDGSSFMVTDAGGTKIGTGSIDLSVADRNVMIADVTISDPGAYTVSYISKSIDGAVLNGTFSFGYKSDASIPASTGGDDDAPDTALQAPASPHARLLAGLPLVLLMVGYTVLSLWIIAQPITLDPASGAR